MEVGFTGTRDGMTEAQKEKVRKYLLENKENIYMAHHGDCVGADKDFHDLCVAADIAVTVHPPSQDKLRAFCGKYKDGVELPPRPYLDRNRSIVDSADVLLATPKEYKEIARSGTWATVRYAKLLEKYVVRIFWPDGAEKVFYDVY